MLIGVLSSAPTASAARAPVAYAQVQKMELSYQCGEVVASALLGDAVTHTLTELGYAIVRPIVVSKSCKLLPYMQCCRAWQRSPHLPCGRLPAPLPASA